jgi:hypothetical protein
MPFFLINVFKRRINWLSILDTVNLCVPSMSFKHYSTLLCIVPSRSVPQSHVFLLLMQSVGALTSLTKTVFCLSDISQHF